MMSIIQPDSQTKKYIKKEILKTVSEKRIVKPIKKLSREKKNKTTPKII